LVPTACIWLQQYENPSLASGSPKPIEPPRPWWPKLRMFGPIQTASGVLSSTPIAWW
jgi:hypothetical protein